MYSPAHRSVNRPAALRPAVERRANVLLHRGRAAMSPPRPRAGDLFHRPLEPSALLPRALSAPGGLHRLPLPSGDVARVARRRVLARARPAPGSVRATSRAFSPRAVARAPVRAAFRRAELDPLSSDITGEWICIRACCHCEGWWILC